MKLSSAKVTVGLCVASFMLGMLGAAGSGCATEVKPAARVSSSEAAIRGARDVGADRVPEAAVHLELAQRQLAQARRYLDEGEHDKATWMLERARVDAELARALAHEARARLAAEEVATRVRDLANGTHASSGDPR